jgi:ABC-type Na+ transport system ATPase subunit NatA
VKLFQNFQITKEGKSIFLSSHILSEVENLADSISIIHGGKIIADGSLEELMTHTKDKSLEDLFISEYKQRRD